MRQPSSLEKLTLRKINRIRTAHGRPALRRLPAGVLLDPDDCPIQRGMRALGCETLRVFGDNIEIDERFADMMAREFGTQAKDVVGKNTCLVPMSPQLRNFVREFDRGRMPALVDHSGRHSVTMAATAGPSTSPSAIPVLAGV